MFGLDDYSKMVAERIRKVLIEDGREFDFDDDIGFFEFSLDLEGDHLDKLRCIISVGLDSYTLYGIPSLKADTGNRRMMTALSKFMHMVNYRLHNGNFQLNFRTGELRYKLYHDCQSSLPSELTILDSILTVAANMEIYSNGLIGLISRRDMTAEEAFEEGERKRMKLIFANNKSRVNLTEQTLEENNEESENGFDAELFLDELKTALDSGNGTGNTETDTFNVNLFDE